MNRTEDEVSQIVWIGGFEYDFTEICDYQNHPMNWEPPFQSNVFMVPQLPYMVHGSNGYICSLEPEIIDLPMNKMRRKS